MAFKRKNLGLMLRIVISFGLIGYFINMMAKKYGGLEEALGKFVTAFLNVSPEWIIPAFFLHFVGLSLISSRWMILLKAQGVNCAYGKIFSFYFMATFFNAFLPSTIGGDTLRAMESKKLTINTTTSVTVVIIERLTGLIALVLISILALFIKLFQGKTQSTEICIFLAAVVVVFFILFGMLHPRFFPYIFVFLKKLLPTKMHAFFEHAYNAVAIYYKKPTAILSALGISFIFQFQIVLYYYLIARSLGQSPEPFDFMLKVPIMIFLLMTVPAINGLGIRTASFKGLMKFPSGYALALECIDVAFRTFLGILGGLIFLFHRRNHKPHPN